MQKDVESKVLAIVSSLSKRNGAGRMSREIVSRLKREPIELVVLTEVSRGTDEFDEYQTLEPHTSVGSFIRNCFRARRLSRGKDIVHAFDMWPYGVYGYAAVLGTKKKLIIIGVGTYSVAPFENSKSRLLVTWACKRAAKILCISMYTKKKIDERIHTASTVLMHQGATALPIPTKVEVDALRKKLQIPENAYPILLTVGEIKERKGQLDTLEGLTLLKRTFPDALYVIVGADTDEYVSVIQKYAHENSVQVIITSAIATDTELASAYSIADIFALNSNNHETHFEGFGLVILEAAQFGLPALGSRDCGIEDAIQDGVSGILVSQMDHAGIAEAIETILNKHEYFKAGARAWFERFTWEHTIDVIMSAYRA